MAHDSFERTTCTLIFFSSIPLEIIERVFQILNIPRNGDISYYKTGHNCYLYSIVLRGYKINGIFFG